MSAIGLERQIACVRRELALRRSVYPRPPGAGLVVLPRPGAAVWEA